MKVILIILALSFSVKAYATNQTIPPDRKITGITVYTNDVVAKFAPAFDNNQGCTSSSKMTLQFSLTDDTNKLLYSTLLAAAASKSNVGFGIGGCTGQYPKLYRVDTVY